MNDAEIDTVEGGLGNDSADVDAEDVIDTVEAPNVVAGISASSLAAAASVSIRRDDNLVAAGLV
jgi:hypothetical protein